MNTNFLSGSHGAIILTDEQTQQLKNWLLENTELTTEDFKLISFEVKHSNDVIDVIGFNGKGITFSFYSDDYWKEKDEIMGLSKEIFAKVIAEQKFVNDDIGYNTKPNDPYNFIDTPNLYTHPNDQNWYETKHDWIKRVYNTERLKELLAQASRLNKIEDMLTCCTIKQGENHNHITIKSFIDHIGDDHPYSLQIKNMLISWEKLNKQKTNDIDSFIKSIVVAKLMSEGKYTINTSELNRDFEGDELTPSILNGYFITSEGDKVDIRDMPDAIEELNGVTWQDKQKARLEVEAQSVDDIMLKSFLTTGEIKIDLNKSIKHTNKVKCIQLNAFGSTLNYAFDNLIKAIINDELMLGKFNIEFNKIVIATVSTTITPAGNIAGLIQSTNDAGAFIYGGYISEEEIVIDPNYERQTKTYNCFKPLFDEKDRYHGIPVDRFISKEVVVSESK